MKKKNLKISLALKIRKPGPGKKAKKLGDDKDDSWESEETKEGYWTPGADDTTGYSSKTADNADDDFKHGAWTKETKPKKYKKENKVEENIMNNAYVRRLMEDEQELTPQQRANRAAYARGEHPKSKPAREITPQNAGEFNKRFDAAQKAGKPIKVTMGPKKDPKESLKAHTEYRRLGALMAEALGLREEDTEPKPEDIQAIDKEKKDRAKARTQAFLKKFPQKKPAK
jgi:hypothetical protein